MKFLQNKSLVLILLSFNLIAFSQINDRNIRLHVLRKNTIGKEYVFGKWTKNEGTESHLKYLGKVKSTHHRTFKIITSTWLWGLSKRATNRILIFNEKNQYIGNYYVSMTLDLPTEMNKGILIFRNTDLNCDSKIASSVSLKKGLPQEFFRECKNYSGDFYTFSSPH